MLLVQNYFFVLSVYLSIQTVLTFFVFDQNEQFQFHSEPIITITEPRGFNFTFLGTFVSYFSILDGIKLVNKGDY